MGKKGKKNRWLLTNTKPTDKYWWKSKTNQWGQRWKKEKKNGSAHTFGARMTSYHMLHHQNTLQDWWKLSDPPSPPSPHLYLYVYPYFMIEVGNRDEKYLILFCCLLRFHEIFPILSTFYVYNAVFFFFFGCLLLLPLSLLFNLSSFHEIFIIIWENCVLCPVGFKN